MVKIYYTPQFIKQFKKLPSHIQVKAIAKEKTFKKNPSHPSLKTHPLTGKLKGFYSFSVTYQYRIMFVFETKNLATFIDIGTHSIYR